jgi:uncharacterized protein YjbI with pentapeptide repeats
MYKYIKHYIHLITLQSLVIMVLLMGTSQAFADTKKRLDDIDERVSTIENQDLDVRVSTIESQDLDTRLGTLEAQNLHGRLGSVESDLSNISLYLVPTVNDLVSDVGSLNTQVLEHEGRLNSHGAQLATLDFYFELLTLHLLTPAPGAILVAVEFIDEDLSGVDLRGANLAAADLTRADIGCSGSGPTYKCAQLDHANLGGAKLEETALGSASLNYANLSGANMLRAGLGNASLVGTNLQGADLTGAYLGGTDLTLANLRGANIDTDLSSVIWNNTICPDGTNSNDSDGDGFTCLTNLSGSIYGP